MTTETIVDAALALLAEQEARGSGLAGNGRFKKGVPPRVSAALVAERLQLGRPKREEIDAINDALRGAFALVRVVRGSGNVYYFGLE